MSVGLNVDPGSLPRDWRHVVRAGVFVILLVAGIAFIAATVAAPIAEAKVAPVERRLEEHITQQGDLPSTLKQVNRKLDALCRATPDASCPLGERE